MHRYIIMLQFCIHIYKLFVDALKHWAFSSARLFAGVGENTLVCHVFFPGAINCFLAHEESLFPVLQPYIPKEHCVGGH